MKIDGPSVGKFQIVREYMGKDGQYDEVNRDYLKKAMLCRFIELQGKIQYENFYNETPLKIGFPSGDQCKNRRSRDNDGTEAIHGEIRAVPIGINEYH